MYANVYMHTYMHNVGCIILRWDLKVSLMHGKRWKVLLGPGSSQVMYSKPTCVTTWEVEAGVYVPTHAHTQSISKCICTIFHYFLRLLSLWYHVNRCSIQNLLLPMPCHVTVPVLLLFQTCTHEHMVYAKYSCMINSTVMAWTSFVTVPTVCWCLLRV